ncbi:ABC transporter permease [Mobilitalea sibirica]|uniref:Transport permease protein n=2 Tax=Mobilitalea sibirica TaxID=1462919 RepID=A0A8J7H547_9FIRM|nr:ABC transporter permease [Mobilitalea sibirica]MBH1942317.1 ABC transporter permease [Mobilitalea sibirica]
MKVFRTLVKTESKLALRNMDSILFGILFPMALALILGVIYGEKPAFEGAGYTFLQQSFGAVAAIGICATGLMGIPLSIADYRHRKILKRFKVTPVSPGLLLFVQVAVQFAIALTSYLAVYLVLKLFFGYKMIGSTFYFLLSYLLVAIAIYGIGMLLASISPNLKTANLLCSLIYFPMLFLSGATVPYEIMPKALQGASDIMPLTQGIKLLKGFSLGLDLNNLMFPIILLSVLAIISFLVSIKFFQWE